MRILFVVIVLMAVYACRSSKKITTTPISIVSRAEWNATEPRPYKKHVPIRITIHHEGTKFDSTADAAKKIKAIQTWGMGKDRNWVDLPYHFMIAPDGKIYEGRDPFTVGETATEYDPTGHLLISCLGNLDVQPVTDAQLSSLINLLAHSAKQFNIPADSIRSHRDYSSQTTCPGKNLYYFIENRYINSAVKAKLNK